MAKKELTLREIYIERAKLQEAVESNCKAFEQKTGIAVLSIDVKNEENNQKIDILLDNPMKKQINRTL